MRTYWSWVATLHFLLFSSTAIFAQQCLSGDCYEGIGTCVYPSGARYTGQFRRGLINGHGTLYFSNGNKYTGNWVNQYREGKGRLIYSNGDEYNGQFRQSKLCGQGVMAYANGDRYTGNWDNDQANGKGVYYYKGGERYEGEFKDGRIEGLGTMFYADGARYTGHWKNNKKDGKGAFFSRDGKRTEGVWAAGRLTLPQPAAPPATTSTAVAAATTTPKLRDCNTDQCKNGRGVYVYQDGSRWEGEFKDGIPEGQGTCYYADGDKYVGSWSQHAPHGDGVMYFKTGRVIGATWVYGHMSKLLPAPEQQAPAPVAAVQKNNAVKIWAVIVGVAAYPHMPPLKYTDDDAYQFFSFLKSPAGGALPDNQVRLLVDEDATHDNIVRNMKDLFGKADDNDVVLLYFSGHGLEGAFIPVDFDGYYHRLGHEEVKTILSQSKAKHKICIADACHSGTMLAMKDGLQTALGKYYASFEQTRGGTALLMSSRGEENSLEDHGLRSGIFTHFLIKGLRGEADTNRDKIVSVRELYDFVSAKVRTYTTYQQSPVLTGDFDDNMPLALAVR